MAGFKNIAGSGYGNPFVDSLVWGGQIWDMSSGGIKVKFGGAVDRNEWSRDVVPNTPHVTSGDEFLFPDIADWLNRYTWWREDIEAMNYAVGLYESVANIKFTDANDYGDANIVWWKANLPQGALGVHESPDGYRSSGHQRWGYFDPRKISSWTELTFGGDGLNTIIHEIGHGLGLAHPHDGGYNSDGSKFPGVNTASDLGTYGHNQSVYTVMSYNPGLSTVRGDASYGTQGGLGAFDIAALQKMYGANTATAVGNDLYSLPTLNMKGTGWMSIWDAGGIDTISGVASTTSVTIDLRAATLISNDPNAGGYISQQKGIAGGFTIANTVVIENAIGGSGADQLIGNSAKNILKGNSGNDTLSGGAGKDSFVFNAPLGTAKTDRKVNFDAIKDFSTKDDSIWLDNKIFTKLGRKGSETQPAMLNKKFFKVGTAAKDKDDYIIYNKKTGVLSYDKDGSGTKYQAVEFAQVKKGLGLTVNDFFVV